MDGGGQAYWVCPLVEESETSDQAAAEARAAALKMRFGDRVGAVHGRMKGADKDAVMAAFQSGGLSVLVATRSEEHTSELQSLMRISYAVFCLKKKKRHARNITIKRVE